MDGEIIVGNRWGTCHAGKASFLLQLYLLNLIRVRSKAVINFHKCLDTRPCVLANSCAAANPKLEILQKLFGNDKTMYWNPRAAEFAIPRYQIFRR